MEVVSVLAPNWSLKIGCTYLPWSIRSIPDGQRRRIIPWHSSCTSWLATAYELLGHHRQSGKPDFVPQILNISSPWCPSCANAMQSACRLSGMTSLSPLNSTPCVTVSSPNTCVYSDLCISFLSCPFLTSSISCVHVFICL